MKTLLRILWIPAAVVAVVAGWLWLDADMGWHGLRLPYPGALLLIAGVFLLSWCCRLFFLVGKGTPHPFAAKTKHLVTTGPYRLVRNPISWGVGISLVGLALLLGSVGLWFGLLFFLFYVQWFVRRIEEPDMERRFGEEYRRYCRQVPRWWPQLPPGIKPG